VASTLVKGEVTVQPEEEVLLADGFVRSAGRGGLRGRTGSFRYCL